MKRPKKVKKCPVCKGKALNFIPWLGMKYRCRKCGYFGPLVIEEEV